MLTMVDRLVYSLLGGYPSKSLLTCIPTLTFLRHVGMRFKKIQEISFCQDCVQRERILRIYAFSLVGLSIQRINFLYSGCGFRDFLLMSLTLAKQSAQNLGFCDLSVAKRTFNSTVPHTAQHLHNPNPHTNPYNLFFFLIGNETILLIKKKVANPSTLGMYYGGKNQELKLQ